MKRDGMQHNAPFYLVPLLEAWLHRRVHMSGGLPLLAAILPLVIHYQPLHGKMGHVPPQHRTPKSALAVQGAGDDLVIPFLSYRSPGGGHNLGATRTLPISATQIHTFCSVEVPYPEISTTEHLQRQVSCWDQFVRRRQAIRI